ncbi:MAG: serine hydrolase [Flavobacterium sp.]|nr:serine hydrolase [Flavobacterium sp.]
MSKISITIIVVVFSVFNINAQSNSLSDRINAVENGLIPFVPIKNFKTWTIAERMKFYNVKGVSIAVIKNYKIDWAKGYGLADTLKNEKVTTQTMFSAGSISKLVMAVGALKLVQDNKLQLDLPINDYLKSWKIKENEWSKTKPLTLRMLLSHTAGASQSSYFGFTPDKKPLPTIVEILNGEPISESRGVVVNSEPGKEFRYSGGGSMIAQMAIMDVSNASFNDFCTAEIFKKLGLKNTTFEQPLSEKFSKKASWAYSDASWFKGMPYVYPQQAAAGLYTSPSDLAKIFIEIQQALLGKGKILNQTLATQMMQPQAKVSDGSYKEEIGVGPFLFQRTDNDLEAGKYFEFTGVNAGFLAYGMASIEGGNGVVIMLNSGDDVNGIGKELRRAVAKAYHWKNFLPDEINPINVDKNLLQEMAGRYRSGADEVITMKVENNYLVESFNNGNPIYCFPVAKDTIVFTDYNIKGFFNRDANGKIISLQNSYQKEGMPKMKDDEFAPSEYLKLKKYDLAKEGFRKMNMNESQITYLAYNMMNYKKADMMAVKTILDLALEQYPNSSIVFTRIGDYYLKINDKQMALSNYKKALTLEPENKDITAIVNQLSKE